MLQMKNIKKKFGELIVLNRFDYNLNQGKITALVGPNGSGKTTLFNIISGFVKPNNGLISLAGEDLSDLEIWQRAKLGISRTFQHINYFQNLTLFDHLSLCFEDEGSLFFNLFKKKNNLEREEKIREVLEIVGLSKPLDGLVCELSYGQKKLVGIAMALLKKHKILLLDEPVAGVNPLLKRKIKDILLKLKERGETIFIIEHDISFVKEVADEIVVIDKGDIIAVGNPNSVFKKDPVIDAYFGGNI